MMPHSLLTRQSVQAPSDPSRSASAQPSPTPSKAPTLAPYAPVSSPSLELQSEGVSLDPLYPDPAIVSFHSALRYIPSRLVLSHACVLTEPMAACLHAAKHMSALHAPHSR